MILGDWWDRHFETSVLLVVCWFPDFLPLIILITEAAWSWAVLGTVALLQTTELHGLSIEVSQVSCSAREIRHVLQIDLAKGDFEGSPFQPFSFSNTAKICQSSAASLFLKASNGEWSYSRKKRHQKFHHMSPCKISTELLAASDYLKVSNPIWPYGGWASEVLHQLIAGKHPIICLGFNHPRWCRISQPCTVFR